MNSNPTPTLRPPRRIHDELLDQVRPPRMQGLLAAGGPTAPIAQDGHR